MERMIMGIDHGNGNIKTAGCVFPCGIKKQDTKPSGLLAPDVVAYKGCYYSLTANRLSYELDKTKDDNCLILTMFAAAKEIIRRRGEENPAFDFQKDFNGVEAEVFLAVGLPPTHLEKQQENFRRYFLEAGRDGMEFWYNGKRFWLKVGEVSVFPQDYAAAMIYKQGLIRHYGCVYCIDIGEGTVDLLALKNGVPDKECMASRELGMAKLREKIIDDVINDYNMTIDTDTIENILMQKKAVIAPKHVVERVRAETAGWAKRIVDQLRVKVSDFRFAPTVFCGGGSSLLMPYLEATGLFGQVELIADIHANAVGYERIAQVLAEGQGRP